MATCCCGSPMHPDLYPYQKAGARFLAARPSAMLADDMGVGKTCQAIAACDEAGVRSALVICPGIARVNWKREFERWQTCDRRVAVIRTSADLFTLPVWCADVLVISYTLLVQEKVRRWLNNLRYDALICDEAHALKEKSSVRSKAVYGSRFNREVGLASRADRVWLLTGTPMPNHPGELWTHVRALWPSLLENVGLRRDDFLFRFCATDPLTGQVVGARRAKELSAMLAPYVLCRKKAEVQPDLPPLRWAHVAVAPDTLPPMPPELAAAAAVLEAAIANAAGDEEAAAVIEAEKMHLATLRRWTGVAKAAAVADLIKADFDAGLDCVVVFALHTAVIEVLAAALGPGGGGVLSGSTPPKERQWLIDEFQAGRLRWLVCQLTVASTALTLTRAAQVVFAESSWVPADMAQAATRTHRIGQERSVLAKVVSLAGSIDEAVNSVLIRKNATLAQITLAQPTQS